LKELDAAEQALHDHKLDEAPKAIKEAREFVTCLLTLGEAACREVTTASVSASEHRPDA
jgi:hypothetical protein